MKHVRTSMRRRHAMHLPAFHARGVGLPATASFHPVFFLLVIGTNVRVWGDGRQSGAAAETLFIGLVRIVPNE